MATPFHEHKFRKYKKNTLFYIRHRKYTKALALGLSMTSSVNES